jgi:hypothetical protein
MMMNLAEKNKILSNLGNILTRLGNAKPWTGYELGINEAEYVRLEELVKIVHIYNGWFKEEQVRKSFLSIGSWLKEDVLEKWERNYPIKPNSDKKVGIIMAGNIPLVGFHDFISVFLAGHKSIIKLSSDDKHLLPALLQTMSLFNESIMDWVEITEAPMKDFDAVIATGSNNSARYFESYFAKYPHIIRKNRTSIAVLTGDETKAEIAELGKDIFDFFGLGCRNVSQIWIPEDFEINRFYEGIYDFNQIVNHNKYANNYDYNKAVMLMNLEAILDNGFLLIKEDKSLNSPLAVVHYVRYKNEAEVTDFIDENQDGIQAIIGRDYIPFGQGQCPLISDYADGVDTMKFLTSI